MMLYIDIYAYLTMKQIGFITNYHFSTYDEKGLPVEEFTKSEKILSLKILSRDIETIVDTCGKELTAYDCYHYGSYASIERITFSTKYISMISGDMRVLCRKIYNICSNVSNAMKYDYSDKTIEEQEKYKTLISDYCARYIDDDNVKLDEFDLIIRCVIYGD